MTSGVAIIQETKDIHGCRIEDVEAVQAYKQQILLSLETREEKAYSEEAAYTDPTKEPQLLVGVLARYRLITHSIGVKLSEEATRLYTQAGSRNPYPSREGKHEYFWILEGHRKVYSELICVPCRCLLLQFKDRQLFIISSLENRIVVHLQSRFNLFEVLLLLASSLGIFDEDVFLCWEHSEVKEVKDGE